MRFHLTVAILKPDLIARPRAAQAACERIVQSGLLIVRSQIMRLTMKEAHAFYKQHKDKDFFNRLISSMTSGPMISMIIAGENAVEDWRQLIGPTKTVIARVHYPHTLRGQFGLTDTRNSFHGAESEDAAYNEMHLLFPAFNLAQWRRDEEAFRTVSYEATDGIHNPFPN